MSNNPDIKDKYQTDLAVVRALVSDFDPSGFITLLKCGSDEYDDMNKGVLQMIYASKSRQEIQDYMVDQCENYYGFPSVSGLSEPHMSNSFHDLDKVLDGLEHHFGNSASQ
jgi:hypothetical protein